MAKPANHRQLWTLAADKHLRQLAAQNTPTRYRHQDRPEAGRRAKPCIGDRRLAQAGEPGAVQPTEEVASLGERDVACTTKR